MGLPLGEHPSALRSSFVWPFNSHLVPFSNVSLFTLSQHEPSHLVLSKAFSTSIRLWHRFSDLYSFHKSYSSQVRNYLTSTLGTSYRCTKGVFTQCCHVAHNSIFPDFSSISQIISFHFSVFCTYGAFTIGWEIGRSMAGIQWMGRVVKKKQ